MPVVHIDIIIDPEKDLAESGLIASHFLKFGIFTTTISYIVVYGKYVCALLVLTLSSCAF